MNDSPLRRLPSVRALLDRPELAGLFDRLGRDAVVRAVGLALDEARAAIRAGTPDADGEAGLAWRSRAIAESSARHLRPAINATGVLLNTGLGRAPLADLATEWVVEASRGYSNLEFDLNSGTRGRRTAGVEGLLRQITGAEAATVVNNNAAATVLALRALAAGREVVVSRGQLVEIGGSFRLPEIFEASGARLREVGTTNRTRLADYARAIGPETAAILRVHPSNYRVVGFTESVGIADLADLAHRRGLLAIDDIGSGMLRDGLPPGVVDEPTAAEGVAAGADVVLFSGDKLLGGPQSGLLVGRSDPIGRIEADPLMRALRVDKMTLAALEVTLRLALDEPRGLREIPLWRMLAAPIAGLDDRAARIAGRLAESGFAASAEATEARLGGGSAPAVPIPSRAVRVSPPYPGGLAGSSEGDLARRLRLGDPAIVPRVNAGAVVLDLKAVDPVEDDAIVAALARLAVAD